MRATSTTPRTLIERRPGLVVLTLSVLTLATLIAIVALNPPLAHRLSREDDVIEWVQAALFALGAVMAVRAAGDVYRRAASPVFEVLIAAMMIGLIIGEVDLDKVLVGRKIISTRFLLDGEVRLLWRATAAFVLVAPPVLLLGYAWWRRAELFAAIGRSLGTSAGRVMLGALAILAFTELFEGPLGHVAGLPRYLVEESLELVASIWFSVGIYAHARAAKP